ncbi:hypothetical protein DB31_1863 [Hyalangium minutum]|uniref:Uncharacterized protein n=1 Tax=Hyalangium minutum TaxID=394096 RepID=A0A085WAY2_9BACT|nr:hypothetical protein DB31_1863 [Hyalangium minutum]
MVKEKLRVLNADLADQLLAQSPPFGFGTLSAPLNRDAELRDCLYELREMITTLQFHLGLDDKAKLPNFRPTFVQPEPSDKDEQDEDEQDEDEYYDLLGKDNEVVGTIALVGLVNRFSSGVFSDHHGLILNAQIEGLPDLNIYYHSLDATHNFSGGTVIRSNGGMLPFTSPNSHDTSLRGAVGFSQQLFKLMLTHDINVIILAEVGQEGAKELLKGSKAFTWPLLSKKGTQASNSITMAYLPSLSPDYSFSVESPSIGNAAQIVFGKGTDSEGKLLGCHILNSMADNSKVGTFMKKSAVSAVFGDTNISTKGSSLSSGFKTIESNTSTTDSLTFDFSNSASDKMFDKLLVRVKK